MTGEYVKFETRLFLVHCVTPTVHGIGQTKDVVLWCLHQKSMSTEKRNGR